MAEAQVAAATPNTPAPAESPTFADSGIGSIFDGLEAEEASPANDTEPAPPPAEGEEQGEEEPANDNAEASKAGDDEIFSDEALSTAEGVKAARDRLLDLRKKSHDGYLGLKKYERKLVKRHEKLQATVEQFRTQKQNYDLTLNNVRSNLQGLHSGDPETILTALGNLTGQDGLKAFEQLASRIVHKGKPPLDPQVQELLDRQQKQIEEMNARYEGEKTQARVQHLNQQIEGHAQALADQITADSSLPNLNHYLAKDPNGTIKYLIDEITDVDGRISPQALFRRIEEQLTVAPQGDGGSGATQKKPAPSAQRSPGQSIGPRSSGASHSREPTEEEALRALAADSQLMSSLGF